MLDVLRGKAAALRQAAADPETDFWLIGMMLDTAADMEAAADVTEAEQAESLAVAGWQGSQRHHSTCDARPN